MTGYVEVAPGDFAPIEMWWDSTDPSSPGSKTLADHAFTKPGGKLWETVGIHIHWGGTTCTWKGHARPINLRAYEGKLYLIALDRFTDPNGSSLFRYYGQSGYELVEVPPHVFPKAVAGQNMDFPTRQIGTESGPRDPVKIAREMYPAESAFRTSLTAYIWNHLTTGEQYEQSLRQWTIARPLLEDFIAAHHPIKLTLIAPDEAPASAGPAGNRN
jgi:hypothetical protein